VVLLFLGGVPEFEERGHDVIVLLDEPALKPARASAG